MKEALKSIEAAETHEPPLPAEAGQYAEATQGHGGDLPEGLFLRFAPE